jgi:hypothetical protein
MASSDDLAEIFKKLPAAEVHALKRRFRKLWRKERKKIIGKSGPGRKVSHIYHSYGQPGTRCHHTQAWRRRNIMKMSCMNPYEDQLSELYKIIHGDRWSFM